MKKLVFTVLIIAFSNFANSAKQEDGLVNDFKAVNNINNKSSLQRGAKYFVNYCSPQESHFNLTYKLLRLCIFIYLVSFGTLCTFNPSFLTMR